MTRQKDGWNACHTKMVFTKVKFTCPRFDLCVELDYVKFKGWVVSSFKAAVSHLLITTLQLANVSAHLWVKVTHFGLMASLLKGWRADFFFLTGFPANVLCTKVLVTSPKKVVSIFCMLCFKIKLAWLPRSNYDLFYHVTHITLEKIRAFYAVFLS